jgi:hypothetical protein
MSWIWPRVVGVKIALRPCFTVITAEQGQTPRLIAHALSLPCQAQPDEDMQQDTGVDQTLFDVCSITK